MEQRIFTKAVRIKSEIGMPKDYIEEAGVFRDRSTIPINFRSWSRCGGIV
jgi:hypothetical protein